MDARGAAVALISLLFLGLAFGTTTGFFKFSLVEGIPTGTAVVLGFIGGLGVLYLAASRRLRR